MDHLSASLRKSYKLEKCTVFIAPPWTTMVRNESK